MHSKTGTLYLFAASVDESAYDYLFLQHHINVAIESHGFYRDRVFSAVDIFERAKSRVVVTTKGEQTPTRLGDGDFPFAITIL